MTHHDTKPDSHRAVADWSTRALIVVWLLAIGAGWTFFERNEFAKADAVAVTAVDRWPGDTSLTYDRDRPALLLFLHPKCPCSRATLAELDRLLANNPEPTAKALQLMIVATVPQNADEAWWDTGTIAKSNALPGARVFIDRAGREAARFGATTSGMVMYFDAAGTLRYAGGITVTRGHEGRSAGGDVVAALVRGESVESKSLPVFGCRLCLPDGDSSGEFVGHVRENIRNSTPEKSAI
jgi:hypothetical protein